MTIVWLVVLVFSSLGMVALLYAKHWELKTGKLLVVRQRPQIHYFLHRILSMVEEHVPNLAREYWRMLLQWLRITARTALAQTLLSIEQGLERILHMLRHGIVPPHDASGQASAFLREVTEYKKGLVQPRIHSSLQDVTF